MRRVLALFAVAGFALSAPVSMAQQEQVGTSMPIDAGRLAAAEETINHIFPSGTYSRMMETTMDQTMGIVMDGVGKVPLRDLAAIGGVEKEKLENLGEGTLSEIMTIYDPYYQQRMEHMMKIMGKEMSRLATKFEPGMREGLQRAYARRFDAKQLEEMNAFFSTSTGKAYASESLLMFVDPEVVSQMQAFMPEMMKEMPNIVASLKDKTSDFPPPRKLKDLSKAERKKLAELLGIAEADLGKANN